MDDSPVVNPQFFERNLENEDPKALKEQATYQLDIVVNLLIRLADKKVALEKFLKG